jgi:hypothetical protein
MKEENIDSMKYRKHTHLAGVDVDIIVTEKGKCVLTIKKAWYEDNVDVSGNKTNGYFIEFVENVKPMVVNSTNRATISSVVKIKTKCTSTESRNIGNWKGLTIELSFDPSIRMMGKVTGGIRVLPISPNSKISDKNGIDTLNKSKTLSELLVNWERLTKEEKSLATVTALKERLKTTLK